ncbi:MAG: hypothetical protein R2909_14055 [Gemmatimonadales bacterium]
MNDLLPVLALGFLLGLRHATDADHVIAVSTIVSHQRRLAGAALIGAVWGLGHSLTVLVVGGGIVLLGWVIPPRVGLSLEFSVGVMLVLLGGWSLAGLWRAARDRRLAERLAGPAHVHPHAHGDYVHSHPHTHEPEAHPHRPDDTPLARLDRRLGGVGLYRLVRPLVVGVVHGLAGSAAVALLVLGVITEPRWAALYLAIFGVGTIVGMMLVTMLIGVPFALGGHRPAWSHRLRLATGVLSVAFGLLMMYRIGWLGSH